MRALQRSVAVLIWPAIAWFGAACDRVDMPTQDTPTEARPFPSGVANFTAVNLIVDLDGMANAATGDCTTGITPYVTISSAVVAASSGQTIGVCPGLYPELVQVNKTLTFLGAQSGVDARTRAVPVTSEAVVGAPDGAFQILADNVVIDGFTIQGVVSNPSAPPFTGLGAGIWTNPGFSGTNGGHQIRNSIIQNNIVGIYLNNNGTIQTTVEHNLVKDNNFAGPASGNGIYSDLGLSDAVIDANKFSGNPNSSILVFGGSNLDVTNNELVGGSPGARIVFGSVNTGTVTGNVSIGSAAVNGTIRLFGGNSNVTISSNTLLNGMRAIRVDDPFTIGINSGIQGHFNCIQGNTFAGLQVDAGGHSGMLNAINNWWGNSTGPTHASNPGGTGDAIVDPDNNVTFIPFLTTPPGPPCPAPPLPASGKVTGGGQIDVPGGKGTFGFNAKLENSAASGHLNYLNHVTRVHLECTVSAFTVLTPTMAKFNGTCSSKSYTGTFMAEVEDNGKSGKADKFKITYGANSDGSLSTTIRSGNIEIHN